MNKFSVKFKFGTIQELWLKNLESGEFNQTTGCLCKLKKHVKTNKSIVSNNREFCCLGVGCHTYIEAGNNLTVESVKMRPSPMPSKVRYSNKTYDLPSEVADELKLIDCDGSFNFEYSQWLAENNISKYNKLKKLTNEYTSLIQLNDYGELTFKEIAKIIRTWPWLIFTDTSEV